MTTTSPTQLAPRLSRARAFGMVLGPVLCLVLWFLPIPALPESGRHALAITLFAVVWWVTGVVNPAYTALLMLVGYIVPGLAKPETVLRLWTTPLMWLMIGAFLIAAAVARSGLATRAAYALVGRFAHSYFGVVLLAYLLGLLLSVIIPVPFPRTLMIMTVIAAILQRSNIPASDRAALGFAVFVAGTATSTVLLTGDGLLNVAATAFSGRAVGWLEWATYMALPGMVACVLMLALHLVVFRPAAPLVIDRAAMQAERERLGPMSRAEQRTLGWLALAVLLWATDTYHGVNPAWIACMTAVGLALPVVGEMLGPDDLITAVNWPIVLFVTGALAIGNVAQETGLAAWIAGALLPATPPTNPYLFATLLGAGTMGIHMVIGSALATMSVAAPLMVRYATTIGWDPLATSLLIYTAVALHYLFPYQQVLILLGAGAAGGYSTRETIRYGVPLTLVTLALIVVVEVTWWRFLGLIP